MAQEEFPEHIASTLAYFFFFLSGILLVTMEPYSNNKTIRLHAWQSIFLSLGFMLFWFFCAILTRISGEFLNFLIGSLMTTSWFAFVCVWIFAMVKAYNGFSLEIPVVSRLAQKFA